ncbi:MAG: nucleotidyltransferase family protein [Sphingomonas sp.]|uniref:nucleotidyltransferase family protein n=1 Tax=Sphingomonas sp. TaxID=28214 RepID=UPI0022751D68|nr:nucleotidyltransferase family protein [Sphingomonas sp.]MCX8477809.1 nucleotidyltransferase family protein [Sphingomonas sp.]
MIEKLPQELRLAIACCRFPFDETSCQAVVEAVSQVSDWQAFERAVKKHRIAGLANIALAQTKDGVPAKVRASIAARAREAAASDLFLAAETARLQQRFDEAAMPALFVKGATAGILAYGGLGVKQSWDIDLLTTPECLLAAIDLLACDGYELVVPAGLTGDALRRFAIFFHEAQLRDGRGVTVELHWRLFSKLQIMSGVTALSECQEVWIGGRMVRTLADELLIPYLIGHGQEHGWSRLKWLADLNALLLGRSAEEFERVIRQGDAMGIGPSTSAALILCEELFGLQLPPDLSSRLRRHRSVEYLVRVNLACIAYPLGGSDMPVFSRTQLALFASRLRVAAGWRSLFDELRALWTQPVVRARYPAHLDFGYHLLRAPIFFLQIPSKLRHMRRAR